MTIGEDGMDTSRFGDIAESFVIGELIKRGVQRFGTVRELQVRYNS